MTLDGIVLPVHEPMDREADIEQESFLSSANRVHTYTLSGAGSRTVRCDVAPLTLSQVDTLETHWLVTAQGFRNSFVVVFDNGKTYTCHYWRRPQFREEVGGFWSASYTFLVPSV